MHFKCILDRKYDLSKNLTIFIYWHFSYLAVLIQANIFRPDFLYTFDITKSKISHCYIPNNFLCYGV